MLAETEAGELTGANEDAREHGGVKSSSVGVAQRRVIAAKQVKAVGQDVFGFVAEAVGRTASDDTGGDQMSQVAIPGDLSETDDNADAWQRGDLGRQMRGTGADLGRRGFVARRSAADDGGDPGVA